MPLGAAQIEASFGARFQIKGPLGEGAMGVVYRAFDHLRGAEVALKSLRLVEGISLFHFKREFRALAHLCHPNLVSLYELHATEPAGNSGWFFTMELVEGDDFLTYARGGKRKPDAKPIDRPVDEPTLWQPSTGPEVTLAPLSPTTLDPEDERSLDATEMEVPSLFDEAKVRAAIGQLARGVEAVHRAGRLHRDLKPSNILVTPRGRVVILDFGLVASLGPSASHESTAHRIVGTAGYMSPEQAMGNTVGPASDWYSFGALLYEALTGQRPFLGPVADVIRKKLSMDARPARSLSPAVPSDLDELCTLLLRRNPEERPSGAEILRRLGASPYDGDQTYDLKAPRLASRLVGREAELLKLEAAFDAVERGRTATVFIRGAAGTGKTALLEHFLEIVGGLGPAIVLRGACDEREVVPYKAFDAIVDDLTAFLRPFGDDELAALLPKDVEHLAQLFPVLRQLPAVVAAIEESRRLGPGLVLDPRELRGRAFRAFRALLGSISESQTVVLAIDDLQWGDADSAALFTELLFGPDSPRLLVLGAHRSEDEATSPLLGLLGRVRPATLSVIEHLDLAPLPPDAIALLAKDRLGDLATPERIAGIVEGAQGLPFFAAELAGALRGLPEGAPIPTLDRALAARIKSMPGPATTLLEILAVAGRAIPESVLLKAAALGGGGPLALRLLESSRLVRSRTLGRIEEDEVLAYHPRIREAVLADLSPQRRDAHLWALTDALRGSAPRDVEAMAMHYYASGERDLARQMAELAAERATNGLAFARAALFLEMGLDLSPQAARIALLPRLAEALVLAGRGADAAQRYLELAKVSPRAEAGALRQKAAEQLLRAGYVDEGRTLMSELIAEEGTKLPTSGARALASLVVRRARVRLRGLAFTPRAEGTVSKDALAKVDRAWSWATGLGMVDSTAGADFQARHLLLALELGEAFRVVRALSMEASFAAADGHRAKKRTAKIVDEAARLANGLGPEAEGLVEMAKGASAVLEGRFFEGRRHSILAEEIFRERCRGVSWEIATAQVFHVMASALSGQLGELVRFVRNNVREAEERGDRYALANLRSGHGNLGYLVEDRPEEAEAALDETVLHLPKGQLSLPHAYELLARTNLDLYRGRFVSARARFLALGRGLDRSVAMRVQLIRIELVHASGRASVGVGSPEALRSAEASAARLASEDGSWARPLSRLLRAGIAEAEGKTADAIAILDAAIPELEKSEMGWHLAAARHRRGALLGGGAGDHAVGEGLSWMSANGVKRPPALLALVLPGPNVKVGR